MEPRRVDAVTLLAGDHRRIGEYLDALLSQDPGRTPTLLEQLTVELRIHLDVEQEVLHPYCAQRRPAGSRPWCMEEVPRRATLLRLVDRLNQVPVTSVWFEQLLHQTRAQFAAHADEEEWVILRLRDRADRWELLELGRRLEHAKHDREYEQRGVWSLMSEPLATR